MTVRTQLAGLVRLAEQLEAVAPAALRQIQQLSSLHDGFPSRGESTGRGSSTMTPVERAVLAGEGRSLLVLTGDRDRLSQAITEAAAAIHAAISVCHRYGAPVDAGQLQCTGGVGHPGSMDWGDPSCSNVQEEGRRGGLCAACRKRRDRWQRHSERVA